MRSVSRAVAVVTLSVFAAACGKAPAEQAIKAVEAAVEAARPEVEKFVPSEWKSLMDSVAGAKSQLEQGQYKEALASAQGLMPQIQAAVAAAAAKKTELTSAFAAVSARLPGALDAVSKQLTAYAAMRKLPTGIDKAAVAAAQAELPNVASAWSGATAAYESGDLMKAVDTALQVKSKIDDLSRTFMPTAAGAPAAK